jgi:hypothetical protein
MLTNVGHEKTRGKPEPYQQVEHRAEQPRERCEQVGSGSGPEPKRRQHWHLVPRPCLARALSHDHGVASPCSSATERPIVYAGGCHPGLLVYCIFYTVKIRTTPPIAVTQPLRVRSTNSCGTSRPSFRRPVCQGHDLSLHSTQAENAAFVPLCLRQTPTTTFEAVVAACMGVKHDRLPRDRLQQQSSTAINPPIRRTRPDCRARAVNGHAAAPPSSVMNSRRLIIRSPRRRGRGASAALRGQAP